MKFLFVTLSREEEPSGIWNTPHKLNKFLKENGNNTSFLTLPRKINFIVLLIYTLKFYKEYLRLKPDIIISFHPIGFIPIFFKKIGLIRNSKNIYYWWDLDIECMGKRWGLSRIAFLEFYCIQNADSVFTNSLFQREMAKKFLINAEYFQLGVEDYFNKNTSKKQLNGKNKFKILFFGDVNKYKKISELINSMKDIDADLNIIGPVSESLDITLPENVYFLGFKPHKLIPGYINSADIIAIPTDQDGTLKMFESLRMGKCILSFQGRIGYFLKHRENAYLCKNFEDGIKFLIKNEKMVRDIERINSKFKVLTLKESFEIQLNKIREVAKCVE